jgi:hypothetical protein
MALASASVYPSRQSMEEGHKGRDDKGSVP